MHNFVLMIMILLILRRSVYLGKTKYLFLVHGCKTLIILLLVSSIHSLSNFLNVDVPVPNAVTDRYFVATLRWSFLSCEICLMQLLYESTNPSCILVWVCNDCSEKYQKHVTIYSLFLSLYYLMLYGFLNLEKVLPLMKSFTVIVSFFFNCLTISRCWRGI